MKVPGSGVSRRWRRSESGGREHAIDHRRECVNAAVRLYMLQAQGLLPKKAS